jgi:TRAP-type uncharacterized transport system fused permease subunit
VWRVLKARGTLQDLRRALGAVLRKIYNGIVDGGMEGAKLGIVIAAMGVIVEMFTVTGFGQRLSYHIVDIAGGNVLLLVLLIAALTIFFGMGMPTPGAYLLTILMASQALMKLGFMEMSVHFFVFYFAIMSSVTPPVAIAVVVAVGIAKANYWDCAKKAIFMALPGFVMPFYFLYCPEILALQTDPLRCIFFNLTLFIAIIATTLAFEGFYIKKLSPLMRIVLFGAAMSIFHPELISTALGATTILCCMAFHYFKNREEHNEKALFNSEL